MHTHRVSSRPTLAQLAFLAIAILTTGIGFVNQLRWCEAISPDQGAFMRVATGCALESMKIVFGLYAMHKILYGTLVHRLLCFPLFLFALCLSGGSILATIGNLVQSDMAKQQATLAASKPYQRDEQLLNAIDAQIREKQNLAAGNRRIHRKSEADTQLKEAEKLMLQRAAVALRMGHAEQHPAVLSGSSAGYFAKMAASLPEIGPHTGEALQLKMNKFIAFAVELGSMISITVLVASLRQRATVASGQAPSLEIVRDEPEKPRRQTRYQGGAARVRNGRVADGRGDTDVAGHNSHRYQRAKQLIQDDELQPSYRSLQQALQISPKQAKRYLHTMWEEGFLQRQGRRFVAA